ncbi:MAG: ferritin [Candidatus Aminicenantes bacterium]|jgi:ferritin|nr:ferritin [Candidatus Aminicenantes bacterium]
MIKKKIEEAFNKQINEEIFSFYLYLSMAAWFDSINLKGFAHWMKIQAQEEMFHAMKFYNHILERGGNVGLAEIAGPKTKWESLLNVYEESLAHEGHITGCINDLMDLVIEEKDHAARSLLQWFVDEQVEEEANFSEMVDKLKMVGNHNPLLLMQDKEMGQRQPGPNPFFKTGAEQ